MFEFLNNFIQSLENMYTVGSENGTVGIDYFRVFGITLFLGLIGYGIMKVLDTGVNNILTALANGVSFVMKGFGDFLTGAGNVLNGIGKAIEFVGSGIGDLLRTPNTLVIKAAEVRNNWINAAKRIIKVTLVDGDRSLTVDISGDVENPDRILTAAADAGDRVYTRPMERMLTQKKPRVIEGEIVE